ncbi:DUF742 domain-containing protein [Streptomyces boncukensis]|uniref:DUF742 domain-containing protein n=1 Tax=Streptomyces boncukensis TaxID=2711219 RepID=A0A6G4X216_9ACTN|nr:DUF742 domain-containing protein [Streptomyces boncukensis]NGO71586.1 DUF742 domain-containing protein [Streptomyces boncukensis]
MTTDRWFDDAAGPVVRPYAMTRGRTRSGAQDARLDLIAVVTPLVARETADGAADGTGGAGVEELITAAEGGRFADGSLAPEHVEIVARSRRAPLTVAEFAAELDLPVGVVRVLIGDLVEAGLVRVSRPVPPAELPDERILREVINGLRAL